jgi:putative heme iron utilization protein
MPWLRSSLYNRLVTTQTDIPDDEPAAILADAVALAATQAGGTLATMHAEDGTPYVTFVFFHMEPDGGVLFGSALNNQHANNMTATPEVSFLVDNREVIHDDWSKFDRLVVEGRAEAIAQGDTRYPALIEALRSKNAAAARFTEGGALYRIEPHRLVLMQGLTRRKRVLDLAHTAMHEHAVSSAAP